MYKYKYHLAWLAAGSGLWLDRWGKVPGRSLQPCKCCGPIQRTALRFAQSLVRMCPAGKEGALPDSARLTRPNHLLGSRYLLGGNSRARSTSTDSRIGNACKVPAYQGRTGNPRCTDDCCRFRDAQLSCDRPPKQRMVMLSGGLWRWMNVSPICWRPSNKISYAEAAIEIVSDYVEQLGLFLRHKVRHGKTYAQLRIEKRPVTLWELLLYLLGSPLLPFLFLYRRAQDVRKSNIYHVQYLRSLPLVFLGIICWSFDEFLGYLAAAVSAISQSSD